MSSHSGERAVILVDPVSSGRHLKPYVRELGHKLIGVFTLTDDELRRSGKHLPRAEKLEHCDAVIEDDDADRVLAAVSKLPFQIAAVIPASEPAVELADDLAGRLALKGNSPASSPARRDKHESRRAVLRAGLNGPAFAACAERQQALAFARAHGLPVVVKTPKGAGAHHVFLCRDREEVAAAFDQVIDNANIFGEATSFALLEAYISGQQYVVDLFGNGEILQVTGLWRTDFRPRPRGLPVFERIATVIDAQELEAARPLCDYAVAVARAVGIRFGPCIIELRDDPTRGPTLIEVGARLSGLDTPLLIRETSSFDPFAATIQLYISEGRYSPPPPPRFSKHAALVLCAAEEEGVVDEISGLDAIARLPSHFASKLFVRRGDVLATSHELATMPLYVYLAHAERAQLERDTVEVRRLFRLTLRR